MPDLPVNLPEYSECNVEGLIKVTYPNGSVSWECLKRLPFEEQARIARQRMYRSTVPKALNEGEARQYDPTKKYVISKSFDGLVLTPPNGVHGSDWPVGADALLVLYVRSGKLDCIASDGTEVLLHHAGTDKRRPGERKILEHEVQE